MTYATKTDLTERFGEDEIVQLTDELNQGEIDDVKLERALADADGEINGYLATRYTLPLASTPAVVKRLACDIARYHLYTKGAPEDVAQRYKDAVETLKLIVKGLVTLGLDAAGSAPVQPVGVPEFESVTPVFGRGDTEGF